MDNIKKKFFEIFPDLWHFLDKQQPIDGKWANQRCEFWRVSYKLSFKVLGLSDEISITIDPQLNKVGTLSFNVSNFDESVVYNLVDKLFNIFGNDSNGISKDECLQYPKVMQLCWMIGINENNELICQQSYDNLQFMVSLYMFEENKLNFGMSFINDSPIRNDGIDFEDFGLNPSSIDYKN